MNESVIPTIGRLHRANSNQIKAAVSNNLNKKTSQCE